MRINEVVTQAELDEVERFADELWGKLGVDVEFTRHFLDRVNDERNEKPISKGELIRLFSKSFEKYGDKIADAAGLQGVLTDLLTKINLPFVINDPGPGRDTDMVAKTVMRKDNFQTSNPRFRI